MAVPFPPDFVNLATGYEKLDEPINLIGVCVDHLPSAKSRGKDFTMRFTLHDPEWFGGIGMPFQFFNHDEKKLPSIQNNGDILIIRNIKTKLWRNQLGGLSNGSTSWVVLEGSTVLESKCDRGSDIKFEKSSLARCPSVPELTYAKHIAKMEDPNSFSAPAAATTLQVASIMTSNGGQPRPPKEKFSLVQDLTVSKFADIIGEVRRIFANDYRVELSVTDYTSHPRLFDYTDGTEEEGTEGDKYGYVSSASKQWRGPWGKMTMLITLWDAHAQYAQKNVREGDYVSLRNVQVAMDHRGGKIEGHCRGDRKYTDRVNVTVMKPREGERDEKLRDLLRRKLEYHKQAKTLYEQCALVEGSSKAKVDSRVVEDERKQPKTKSKAAKNREKKDKKKARYESVQTIGNKAHGRPNRNDLTLLDLKTSCNPQIRCLETAVPLKTIDSILNPDILQRATAKGAALSLPFQNCKYKSRVKVVDFFPDNIADFAAPRRITDYDGLSDFDSESEEEEWMTQAARGDLKWEWRFLLLVEDPAVDTAFDRQKRRMELLVSDSDGDFLLDMDACDFRRRPDQVDILREKLFILWGNLEEAKEAANAVGAKEIDPKTVQARPFECFIKEYGVTRKGADGNAMEMERMFRMFGTTIK